MKLDPPTPIPSFPALARRCRDAGAAVPQVAMAQYTLNVREADIRAFVADAAEVTGRTFIVDARAGKVSVVSERPLSRSEYFEVFLSTCAPTGWWRCRPATARSACSRPKARPASPRASAARRGAQPDDYRDRAPARDRRARRWKRCARWSARKARSLPTSPAIRW
jgi:hypothetical protein